MLTLKRPGTIVPPLTPFTPDLGVDYSALERQIDYVVDRCHPSMVIAAAVEAQEYQYLTLDARRDLVRETSRLLNKRAPIAVGVSHPSFRIAIELAHLAEDVGASAIQVLAPQKPTGGSPTTRELVRYIELIARETALPIILYLNAGPGADLSVQTTLELAKLDPVHFLKESSRDLTRVSRLIAEIDHAGHARYFTTMQMLLATLHLGGSGVTLPPPAAEIAWHIIQAYLDGQHLRAAELQQQFALFPARWMGVGLAAVMKAASNILGLEAGDPYPPYEPLRGPALDELRSYLATTLLQNSKEPADA
jgi:4-hydroxy-tetrahydrodipicolinate synthase